MQLKLNRALDRTIRRRTTSLSPGTIGGFAVVGGAGDYSGLHGAGSLIGTRLSDTEILDVYTGRLSN